MSLQITAQQASCNAVMADKLKRLHFKPLATKISYLDETSLLIITSFFMAKDLNISKM